MQVQWSQILEYFMRQQLPDGGFPNQLGQPSDILTTCSVVKLLIEEGEGQKYRDQLKKALLNLYQAQMPNGKWGEGYKVWETCITAKVLRAFQISGLEVTSDVFQKGFMWLQSKQKTNGAFAMNDYVFQPHLYATASALRLLSLLENSYQDSKTSALEWIASVQKPDGGFSVSEEHPSDACLTAYVLAGILPYDNYMKSNLGQNAIEFLLNAQSSDGTWSSWFESGPSMEATSSCLHVLATAGSRGPMFQRGYGFLEQKLNLATWDSVPLWQLISVMYALTVQNRRNV